MLHVPRVSSFISNQFFVLNLDWLIWCTVSQISYFLMFHYHTTRLIPRLSITFCLFSGDIYLSISIVTVMSFFFFFFWFFDISLLYYFKLSSFIIYCLSSKDTYFTLGISLLFSFVIIFELFCCEFFETFVILSAVLLPIKPPVSWLYWISRYFL